MLDLRLTRGQAGTLWCTECKEIIQRGDTYILAASSEICKACYEGNPNPEDEQPNPRLDIED